MQGEGGCKKERLSSELGEGGPGYPELGDRGGGKVTSGSLPHFLKWNSPQ